MDDVTGAHALVTGGASGIGKGLATSLLERGVASVTIADIEPAAIDATVAELSSLGHGAAVGAACDVTDAAAVEAVVAEAWARTGGIQVACLNAGVFAGGHAWETTDDDWDWVLGVNLRGVVNGIRAVVPRMIAAEVPSHVLVTASVAGVVAAPVSAVYATSKFAALGLTESLHHDLVLVGADHVAVSAICPGMVSTNIDRGDRNRPAELAEVTATEGTALAAAGIEEYMARGEDPVVGARRALDGAFAGRFYVTTDGGDLWERLVGNENEDRLAGRPPRFQMYE